MTTLPFILSVPEDASSANKSQLVRIEVHVFAPKSEIPDRSNEDRTKENSVSKEHLFDFACKIMNSRKIRNKLIGTEILGEPAWDMLLSLYCLPARGETLVISDLALCADVPSTTGLRWEGVLRRKGFIERLPHKTDKRVILVRLSELGRQMMDECLRRIYIA